MCVWYIPESTENQIPPYVGQDNLFGDFKVELDHANLIRISLLMWWKKEVKYTSNYFLEIDLQEYIKLDHADLYRACQLESRNRSH